MIKAVLFDIDGTLLDTEKQVIAGLQETLREQKGLQVAAEDLFYTLGIPGKQVVADFADSDSESDQLLQSWESKMKTNFNDVQIFPGIVDLLEGLREKGLLLAIVTSKNKSEFVDEVTPFGLNSYFQAVITASDTLKHKPNPEPVLKGLDELQVLAEQTIYVGDAVYDLRSGKAAGTKFAFATWGAKFHSEFEQADYQLQHPQDLLQIITKENSSN